MDAVSKNRKQDFLTNNVLRGDTQVNHRLSNKSDIIAGVDFSLYQPNSNRLFLNDKGPDSRPFGGPILILIGEEIKINEIGAYIQYSAELPYDLKLVTASRIDKHTYFDYNYSPRLALQWNGLKGGNIRFTVNRAFQTPLFLICIYSNITMQTKVTHLFLFITIGFQCHGK